MSDTAPIQTPELKPCPFCGSPASEDGNNLIGILISCSNAKCPVSPDVSGKNRAYAYPAWNTRAEDADHIQRVAEALRTRYEALEKQLAELRWVRIDEGHLPKVGDEFLTSNGNVGAVSRLVARRIRDDSGLDWMRSVNMTHYRPINPPQPTAPVAGEQP
jgi:hypothetical protein